MKRDYSRYLAPMVDRQVFVQDAIEAQGIALVCGLVGQFKSADKAPTEGGWIHALPFMDHPTHWVFVVRYTGFPNPADNGWSAMFFPKSQMTFDEAEAGFRNAP